MTTLTVRKEEVFDITLAEGLSVRIFIGIAYSGPRVQPPGPQPVFKLQLGRDPVADGRTAIALDASMELIGSAKGT